VRLFFGTFASRGLLGEQPAWPRSRRTRTAGEGLKASGPFLLTLATAVIHLYLALSAVTYMGLNFGVMLFVLNGLGYLGLLAALQLPIRQLARFRSAARWALVA